MVECCCCSATFAIGTVIVAFVGYKFLFSKRKDTPKLNVENWKKDVVYLFQFPRITTAPNLSPFCLKIESMLRVYNIKHEIIETMRKRGDNGQLPFIELNGKQIADSQLIDVVLREHFNISSLPSKRDEGFARAIDRMLNGNTFGGILYFKVLKRFDGFTDVIMREMSRQPSFLIPFLQTVFRLLVGKRLDLRTRTLVGDFSTEEFRMLLKKDFDALVDILGDRKFLFGDEITPTDCSLFGQLVTVHNLSYDNEVQSILRKDYKPLLDYIDRFRQEVFPNDFIDYK
ncbi:hypothetical protein WR25_24465 [Diploscapter pachys]|uniref:GST C-terminal domain-containing protein n=1 Tax=Diploscapter pachys TaxID=2018661 RepID=A0A2A2LJV5_9BILA|nr:hypothetical protein WR25_24465 [Diploscapter pachys]